MDFIWTAVRVDTPREASVNVIILRNLQQTLLRLQVVFPLFLRLGFLHIFFPIFIDRENTAQISKVKSVMVTSKYNQTWNRVKTNMDRVWQSPIVTLKLVEKMFRYKQLIFLQHLLTLCIGVLCLVRRVKLSWIWFVTFVKQVLK